MFLPDVQGDLAKVTTAIAQKGDIMIALGTFLGKDPANFLVAIKVAEVPKEALVEALTPLAVQRVDAREI